MRPNLYLLFLIALLSFTACKKSDIEHENSFERSFKAWKNFRESSSNSYRYVIADGSWTGYSWQTTLTVIRGVVTRRDFQYNTFHDILRPAGGWDAESREKILAAMKVTAAQFAERTGRELEDVLEWSEEEGDLGKNMETPAYPLMTLDEVYDKAKNDWLKKRENAKVTFETRNNGLISSCGYTNDGCQDDCFNGITISSIDALLVGID
ncbi:hypothetical protein [Arcticibacter tournemirensis]|uniref:Uncharacterized protein n=1 Tax=Arcticibacter tournemirensis TaxID=699437 RepID=A0A4Q0M408_9SPHI|nr:hypothetical protein [Arcticibacter tournemirensis]RXF67661.1 hypothetical protein EKH83_18945 [Arcticibacter tournemirensis]